MSDVEGFNFDPALKSDSMMRIDSQHNFLLRGGMIHSSRLCLPPAGVIACVLSYVKTATALIFFESIPVH